MKKTGVGIRDFSLVFALAAIWLFFALKVPDFVGARNLTMLTIELSTTAVAALGMLLIILLGHIDLSVGSAIGLTGGIAAVLVFKHEWGSVPAMAASVAVGLALYAFMGYMVAWQKIPAFIITLGGLLIFRGLFWKVINNETIPVKQGNADNLLSMLTTRYLPSWLGYVLAAAILIGLVVATLRSRTQRRRYGFEVEPGDLAFARLFVVGQVLLLSVLILNRFRGIPLSLVVLGTVAFIVHVVTRHTRFGRYLYATGGNIEAATISGVPVKAVTIGAFLVAGVTATVTGFMQTAYSGASTTTTGDLMELDAIASCVIGGTSLSGGRGTVTGVLIGAFLIASLMNGMTLMAVSPEVKFVARGVVLALAVWMDTRLSRRG